VRTWPASERRASQPPQRKTNAVSGAGGYIEQPPRVRKAANLVQMYRHKDRDTKLRDNAATTRRQQLKSRRLAIRPCCRLKEWPLQHGGPAHPSSEGGSDPEKIATDFRRCRERLVRLVVKSGALSQWLYFDKRKTGLPTVCIEAVAH